MYFFTKNLTFFVKTLDFYLAMGYNLYGQKQVRGKPKITTKRKNVEITRIYVHRCAHIDVYFAHHKTANEMDDIV